MILLAAPARPLTPVEAVGKRIFFDAGLSRNRNQSCATCHAPAAGFSGPDPAINAGGAVYQGPFLNPVEQGLPDAACVVQRVCAADYGADLRALHPQAREIAFPKGLEDACAKGRAAKLAPAARGQVQAGRGAAPLHRQHLRQPGRAAQPGQPLVQAG